MLACLATIRIPLWPCDAFGTGSSKKHKNMDRPCPMSNNSPFEMGRTLRSLLWGLLFCVAQNLMAAEPALAIRNQSVKVENGVLLLSAETIFPLDADIRAAVNAGVTLSLDFRALITRRRAWWFDADVIDIATRRELAWLPVSQRYVLRDPMLGTQQVFTALDAALAAAGKVSDWPVVVEPQFLDNGDYQISVRASMRRGRMSTALRRLVFWSDGWDRRGEWMTWALPR